MRKTATDKSREISEEKLAELKHTARAILADARKKALQRLPFTGSIMMSLNLVPTRDYRNPTAMTDGSSIYFDISFLSDLTPEERVFVLAHEVWHNVMMHSIRLEGRDQEVFNIAADLEVNQALVHSGLTMPKDALSPDMCHLPTGKNAEWYYDYLMNMNKTYREKLASPLNGASSSRGSRSCSSDQPGESPSSEKTKNSTAGQFDRHLDEHTKLEDEEDPGVADKWGKVGKDKDLNIQPEKIQASMEKVREAALCAAQSYERMRGTLPGHLASLVESLTQPTISWKDLLTAHVTRIMGDKSDWNTPSRRFAYSGTYLPSHSTEKLKIAVGIDTSGSANSDLDKFLTELTGLVSTFPEYEVTVIQCDTEVKDVQEYSTDNPIFADQPFSFQGGGGTCLTPIFNYIQENSMDVDSVVVFTDGYCENMEESIAPDVPTLWVLTSDGTSENLHFGDVAKIDKSA